MARSKSDDEFIRQTFGYGPVGDVASWINGFLDRSIAESKERDRVLQKRARLKHNEKLLRGFESLQECPNCLRFGNYTFELDESSPSNLFRECDNCGHTWEQS